MRVVKIGVKRLFGLFDHEIPLQSSERVTIIHGPNGFGKTVILKMIAALLQGKLAIFEHTPFDEFSLTLDDGTARVVRRSIEKGKEGPAQVHLELFARDVDGALTPVSVNVQPNVPKAILQAVDRKVPGPYRLSGGQWTDGQYDYSLAEILEIFPNAAEPLPPEYTPGLFLDISRELKVFFIETNRLSAELSRKRSAHTTSYSFGFGTEPSESPTPRVKYYSDEIVQRIRTVLTDYARHSQERDRTFPERLVRFVRDRHRTLPEREILSKMAELEEKRNRLISLGLLDSERGLQGLTEEDVKRAAEALTIYVVDIEEKLKVFDDMARRIGALIDIINSRFKYKRLIITRELGFRVVNGKRQLIELADLSSGEQHELVVLYELLFRCPNNGLVLVDEPEISLHVAWQARFLSDLISILDPTDSYAIVATHSPVIIGHRSDLTVELEGPELSEDLLEHARAR